MTGKQLFAEALLDGTMEGFFKLIEQFRTQDEPAYCGLARSSFSPWTPLLASFHNELPIIVKHDFFLMHASLFCKVIWSVLEFVTQPDTLPMCVSPVWQWY